jgi:hypothetical protein
MPKPENLIGKGFDARPENINRHGRPRRLIAFINNELKKDGYTPASKDEITDAYLTMLNLPYTKIKEISKSDNEEYPMLYKLVAQEMLGKRGQDMLERLLDRAIGRAQQPVEIENIGGNITVNFKTTAKTDPPADA